MEVIKHKFENREEAMEFLAKYNFKRYVPRLEENRADYYYIETTNNNKVYYCSTVQLSGGCIYKEIPFYICNKAYDFPLADMGEVCYKERLEMQKLQAEIEAEYRK